MSANDYIPQAFHRYGLRLGLGEPGRFVTLCAECRRRPTALGFLAIRPTIEPCTECGKTTTPGRDND